MKERPILFSAAMFRSILSGAKTQTRRFVKPQPTTEPLPREEWGITLGLAPLPASLFPFRRPDPERANYAIRCPYGEPGDRLWVREAWQAVERHEDRRGRASSPSIPAERGDWDVIYRADHNDGRGWRSPIHMPRWASRITLEVTGVRVERVQDLTEADARAEGVRPFFEVYTHIGRNQRITSGEFARDAEHRASFACLWDETYGKPGGRWLDNPWVWCISFQVVESP